MKILQVSYPVHDALSGRNLSLVTDFIVHHSDGALTQGPLDIDIEHRNRGWAMIGYHYVITPNGDVYEGRPITTVPAAAYGRNLQSVDVCLVGDFQPGTPGFSGSPTEAQVASLKELRHYIQQVVPSIARTIGHRDVAPDFYPQDEGDYSTACPGDNLEKLLPEIRSAA
jgi:N-acetylmuramoyl-L-alanine amidase